MDHTENSKLPFVAEDYHHYISPPYTPPSINILLQNQHAHFKNYLYPMYSTIDKFNVLQSTTTQKADSSFMPYEDEEEHDDDDDQSFCPKSDTDSCSQFSDEDEHEEEVNLDELLHNDVKAKKKIEVLAEMVGVESTEPLMVLTEVVRVLKQLRRMN